jgi:peptidoglycan L-alanyl-D-glutamate endopeptidase CwlK
MNVIHTISAMQEKMELRSGSSGAGNRTSIKNQPHSPLRPAWAAGMAERDMLAELRRRKDSGTDFYA